MSLRKMDGSFGIPKDIWAKLILLNQEGSKLDWTLQKRNGAYKLSIFWNAKMSDGRDVERQPPAANLAKPRGNPWNNRDKTALKTTNTDKNVKKPNEGKHTSLS